MLNRIFLSTLLSCFLLTTVTAQKYVVKSTDEITTEWNGNAFSSSRTFAENINDVNTLSFLQSILKDETLLQALANEEMVTIFAPVDASFSKLSKEAREALLSNTGKLRSTMKLFTVPGRLDSSSIHRAIQQNGGTAYFTTLAGEKVGAKMRETDIVLFDSENNTALLSATDFYHKNGLFHIVEGLIYTASVIDK